MISVDQAKRIVSEIVAARKKWGKQANPPYKLDVIMDALVQIAPELSKPAQEGPSPEEVTKLRRQLAACQNREKGRTGKVTETD